MDINIFILFLMFPLFSDFTGYLFMYLLGNTILVFQTVNDGHKLLKHLDETLGEPLPEKAYGGNCLIYDPDRPDNVFHNFWVCISPLLNPSNAETTLVQTQLRTHRFLETI